MHFEEFANSFEESDWHATIDGPIDHSEFLESKLVNKIVTANCTIGFALKEMLKIQGNDLAILARYSYEFLEAMIEEFAFIDGQAPSDEQYLNGMIESVDQIAIPPDLIELAVKDCDPSKFCSVIRDVNSHFKSHEAVEAAICLAGAALAIRLYRLDEMDAALEATFVITELASSVSSWKLGSQHAISKNSKKAADARHNKKGGSRDVAQQIKALWASGKYSSRDLCAEQECAAFDLMYASARDHLKNTPDPDPWPARAGKKAISKK